jgi:hypothetical protein
VARSTVSSFQPVFSWRSNISGGDDAAMWINKKQGEDFAMARLGGICQREWRDPVLERVGEGDQTTFLRIYASQILRNRDFVTAIYILREAVYMLKEVMHVLFVTYTIQVRHSTVPESQ